MEEEYVIIRTNGEVKRIFLNENNKYDIDQIIYKEKLNNSFIFSRNGTRKIETWNGCLEIAEGNSIEQQEKVEDILSVVSYMKSFYSQSDDVVYPFKGREKDFFSPSYIELEPTKTVYLYNLIKYDLVIIFPERGFESTYKKDSYSFRDTLSKITKQEFLTIEEYYEYLIRNNYALWSKVDPKENILDLYLPEKLTLYQRKILMELIEKNYEIDSVKTIQDGNLVSISDNKNTREIISMINFSSKPEPVLSLSKKRL